MYNEETIQPDVCGGFYFTANTKSSEISLFIVTESWFDQIRLTTIAKTEIHFGIPEN